MYQYEAIHLISTLMRGFNDVENGKGQKKIKLKAASIHFAKGLVPTI